MTGKSVEKIKKALNGISYGVFDITSFGHDDPFDAGMARRMSVSADGKGKIDEYVLFSGVTAAFHQYMADEVHFKHDPERFVLHIDYCNTGRIGWNIGGETLYLGSGDMCIHSSTGCSDSAMALPLGYYDGISFSVDLRALKTCCPPIVHEAGFDADMVYEKFCSCSQPFVILSNSIVESVFLPLYAIPEDLKIPYCKLKAQEMLAYLIWLDLNSAKETAKYGSQQAQVIKELHDFLVDNLETRYTIEALAKKYLLNTSTLKTMFKDIYGMPVASYVKERRMEKAMKLLQETDETVASIAEKVGYESQGKFAQAFKEKTSQLPTEYRKLYRK